MGSERAADSKLNVKINAEPTGQEQGGRVERGWGLKGLWRGDGCAKAALEKEVIRKGRSLLKG